MQSQFEANNKTFGKQISTVIAHKQPRHIAALVSLSRHRQMHRIKHILAVFVVPHTHTETQPEQTNPKWAINKLALEPFKGVTMHTMPHTGNNSRCRHHRTALRFLSTPLTGTWIACLNSIKKVFAKNILIGDRIYIFSWGSTNASVKFSLCIGRH